MLSREENELLTRVGAGTPMGDLLRQYWIPALLSTELPAADSPPLRVMLLGERLIAFRDSAGRAGLFAEACPHRGASLFLGRCAEGGLRCAYHGWKFDVSGSCLEMPQEPREAALKHRVRAKAYPCRERGGVVWAYLGPRETPPPLPELESNLGEDGAPVAGATMIDCNWLQNLEGDLDIHHLRELHQGALALKRQGAPAGFPGIIEQLDRTPASRMETADTAAGFAFAACEEVSPGGDLCWGVGQFLFPFYAMLPQDELGSYWVVCRVPMDDTHTMTFGMFKKPPEHPTDFMVFMVGPEPAFLPNDASWFGRFRMARNPDNDFGLDRRLQNEPRSPAFGSGISGQAVQDAAVCWSMGPIASRSEEHLGEGDAAVIRVRQRLLEAARALAKRGQVPPGVEQPQAYRVKQGSLVLPRSESWAEALKR